MSSLALIAPCSEQHVLYTQEKKAYTHVRVVAHTAQKTEKGAHLCNAAVAHSQADLEQFKSAAMGWVRNRKQNHQAVSLLMVEQ